MVVLSWWWWYGGVSRYLVAVLKVSAVTVGKNNYIKMVILILKFMTVVDNV